MPNVPAGVSWRSWTFPSTNCWNGTKEAWREHTLAQYRPAGRLVLFPHAESRCPRNTGRLLAFRMNQALWQPGVRALRLHCVCPLSPGVLQRDQVKRSCCCCCCFSVKRFREPVGIRRPWRIWSELFSFSLLSYFTALPLSDDLGGFLGWTNMEKVRKNVAPSVKVILCFPGFMTRPNRPSVLCSSTLPMSSCPLSPKRTHALCELSDAISLPAVSKPSFNCCVSSVIWWISCWMQHLECLLSGWL